MQLTESHLDSQWGSTKVRRGRAPVSAQSFPNRVPHFAFHTPRIPGPYHPHNRI